MIDFQPSPVFTILFLIPPLFFFSFPLFLSSLFIFFLSLPISAFNQLLLVPLQTFTLPTFTHPILPSLPLHPTPVCMSSELYGTRHERLPYITFWSTLPPPFLLSFLNYDVSRHLWIAPLTNASAFNRLFKIIRLSALNSEVEHK